MVLRTIEVRTTQEARPMLLQREAVAQAEVQPILRPAVHVVQRIRHQVEVPAHQAAVHLLIVHRAEAHLLPVHSADHRAAAVEVAADADKRINIFLTASDTPARCERGSYFIFSHLKYLV